MAQELKLGEEYTVQVRGRWYVVDFFEMDAPDDQKVGLTVTRSSDGKFVDAFVDIDADPELGRVYGG